MLCYNPSEEPLVLQLSGSNPNDLACCAHIAADIGLEYDVLIDSHIVQESRWKEIGEVGYRFYKNVMAEGVSLVAAS